MAAAGRPRRLGVDGEDTVSGVDQRVQDRRGKSRRAHEDEVERWFRAWCRVLFIARAPAMHDAGQAVAGARLRFRLGELAQDHSALQQGEMVDEQHAVEMVDLVLQAGREKPRGLDLADLVLVVEIAQADLAPGGSTSA